MLFYILLSVVIVIGGWAAYKKYVKKEDKWSGSPISGGGSDEEPSIDTLIKVPGNNKPKKIKKKKTPKGIDLGEELDVIKKEKRFPKKDFEKPLPLKKKKPALPVKPKEKPALPDNPKAKRKYKPRKKK